jgi:hypothetical protein
MRRWLLALIPVLALGACATATYYQPSQGGDAIGYADSRIEANRWRVSFQGGDGAPESQVSDFALLRAAELTVQNGYDWFRIVGRDGSEGPPHSASSISLGTGGATFGRHSGFGMGLGTTIPVSGGPRIQRSIEIIAGKGPAPSDPDIYSARNILDTIGPRAPHPPPPHG